MSFNDIITGVIIGFSTIIFTCIVVSLSFLTYDNISYKIEQKRINEHNDNNN